MKNIRTEEELVALQTCLVTDDDRDVYTASMQSRFFPLARSLMVYSIYGIFRQKQRSNKGSFLISSLNKNVKCSGVKCLDENS